MANKTVIITGANTGIGYATAEGLANMSARVILACRDPIKAKIACEKIKKSTGNPNVEVMILDLTDFESIRKFVDEFN
jgi:NAD(P)-dependent dehydrogenase (short-subunit alcohol dehydrogenase family)